MGVAMSQYTFYLQKQKQGQIQPSGMVCQIYSLKQVWGVLGRAKKTDPALQYYVAIKKGGYENSVNSTLILCYNCVIILGLGA